MKTHIVKTTHHFKYNREQYRIIRHIQPYDKKYIYTIEEKVSGFLRKEKWKSLLTSYFYSLEEAEERLKLYMETTSTYDHIARKP